MWGRVRDAWAVLLGRAVVVRGVPAHRFRVGYVGASGTDARKCWEALRGLDLKGEFVFEDALNGNRGRLTR